MRCKCNVIRVNGTPTRDGSIVPLEVISSYLNSQECKDNLKGHKMFVSLIQHPTPTQIKFVDEITTPTHYIDELYIEDSWLCAGIKILEETEMDDAAIQNIRRLKGMVSQGIFPDVRASITGYWNKNTDNNGDVLVKMENLNGMFIILNENMSYAETEPYNPSKNEEKVKKKI